jgi:hypothetical protein
MTSKRSIPLTISVTIPLIILYSVILMANEFTLLSFLTIFFCTLLNYTLFRFYEKEEVKYGIGRVVISILIITIFGFGFAFLDFLIPKIALLSSFKLGWIIGSGIVVWINLDFRRKDVVNRAGFLFGEDVETEQDGGTIVKKWILIISIYTVLAIFFAEYFHDKIGYAQLFITLLFLGLNMWYVAKNHGLQKISQINLLDSRKKVYLIGSVLVFISLFIFLLPELNFIGLFLLGTGIFCMEHSTCSKELWSVFKEFVVIPLVILYFMFLFFPKNNSFLNAFIIRGNGGEIAKGLIKKQEKIEDRMFELFSEWKEEKILPESINPVFKARIINNPSMWDAPKIDLELYYSYEQVGEYFIDTIRYYKRGQYQLNSKDKNIAYLTATAFKISIEQYLSEYFQLDRNVEINLIGVADALKIKSELKYKGEFSEFSRYGNPKYIFRENEYDFSLQQNEKIDNQNLAVLRALGVRKFIHDNIRILREYENVNYFYEAIHDENKAGPDVRKVEIKMTIFNVTVDSK